MKKKKKEEEEWSIIDAPPNDRRVKTENREELGGERVNGGGGGRGEGRRCLHRRLFAKYWPTWKLDHQLIMLSLESAITRPSVKVTSPNFYAQAPHCEPCAQSSLVLKYWIIYLNNPYFYILLGVLWIDCVVKTSFFAEQEQRNAEWNEIWKVTDFCS